MLTAVDSYIDQHAARLEPGVLDVRLHPKTFCDAAVLEARSQGTQWVAGLEINCGEFARSGTTLIEGAAGDPGIGETALLARHGRSYRVLSLQVGPPYYAPDWVSSHYSSGSPPGFSVPRRRTAPNPIRQAWAAFGFPAGTRAVQK